MLHRQDAQLVIVDTPGLHRPRSALGSRLNDHVSQALADVDIVVVVLDATAPIGPGDRRALACALAGPRTIVVVNKTDRASKAAVAEHLLEAQSILTAPPLAAPDDAVDLALGMAPGTDSTISYFPLSAARGDGVDELVEEMVGCLPEGPPYFPPDMLSDAPEAFMVAELVREQILAHVRAELPHSVACRVVEWEWPRIRVEILVERDSQKAIVIGRSGEVLKAVGSAVRAQLDPGAFIELHVGVARHWQASEDLIERLGY